jgi:hypothetical protein
MRSLKWVRWFAFGFLALMLVGCLSGSALMAQDGDGFSPAPAVEVAPVYGEPSQQELSKFRRELLKVAEQEVKAGNLSRFNMIRLRIAANSQFGIKLLHQCCAEQAFADGQIKSYSEIKWDQLLELFKELIPIILELIKVFACIDPSMQMLGSELQFVFYDLPRPIGRSNLIGCSVSLAA